MDKTDPISLLTICDGSVPEVFERELRAVLANIADPTTELDRRLAVTDDVATHQGVRAL
jgi:hypothetical protein